MDQIKIGTFIAKRRKEQKLTQLQLADLLGITDKAVSKWERGLAMPDPSLMLDLCGILKITVNDLLSGEVVTMENYDQELEKRALELVRRTEQQDRYLLKLEWVLGILSCIVLFVPVFIAALVEMDDPVRLAVAFSGFIPALVGLHFAIKIEQTVGLYRCRRCGHSYVPELGAVYVAPHFGRTRFMRCPACGKRSWQKKALTRD